ncbi:glycosyltransferase [Staphylococcus xylosus]|uniref:glycosyltransferase n=1 Tax=Staphylococcus xylosus TaxID=1288 RepID=UPI00034C2CBE|nr:glycosyltransferase family 4 protein [Staphylococcus xylosus]
MKITFVHDFPVLHNPMNNKYYSTGFPYTIWKRYLPIFNKINVVSRIKIDEGIKDTKNISSGENVEFSPLSTYSSLKTLIFNYKKITRKLNEEIQCSEGVIIRLPSILGFLAANICRKQHKPYLVEVVGSIFDAYWHYGTLFSKVLAFPGELLQKISIKNASVAIYITEEYLQSKYPTMGVSFDSISNVEVENDFKNKIDYINKVHEPFKIGLVGSTFVKYKGHATAIRAVSELKRKGYSVSLEFVGQGLSDYIKETIESYKLEENVKYIGVINNRDDINEWYRSLDLYIQPSKTEGHGRSIVEAIGNGTPVIASNVGGIPDSVHKKYLFDVKKEKELANLIERCILDIDFAKENISANINKIEKYKKSEVTKKRNIALEKYKNILLED